MTCTRELATVALVESDTVSVLFTAPEFVADAPQWYGVLRVSNGSDVVSVRVASARDADALARAIRRLGHFLP